MLYNVAENVLKQPQSNRLSISYSDTKLLITNVSCRISSWSKEWEIIPVAIVSYFVFCTFLMSKNLGEEKQAAEADDEITQA